MTAAQESLVRVDPTNEFHRATRLESPRVEDGAALWRIARDSEVLDLNSSYSYLLWCRDFAATSLVARGPDGEPVAFVTGYARPDRPRTLVVWQIAVDRSHRGRGLAGALLDALTARTAAERGIREVETTITPDNHASERLFTAFAERQGAGLERETLFGRELFPAAESTPAAPGAVSASGAGPAAGPEPGGTPAPHEPEVLYRIGPLTG
jgi:L-2,4-diaminobutyric acid acetyltransferase